jgi:tetratricopeptide (TPR) repeat protein
LSLIMRKYMGRALLFALLGALGTMIAAGGAGCGAEREREARSEHPKASGELMTCLAMIRAHHKQADLYLKMGELSRAIDRVAQILEVQCPAGKPEAVEALLDAHSRLAGLLLKKGDVARAAQVVEAALKRYETESFFMAHLLMVQADVLEARAARLDGEGKIKEAKKLRRKAIAVLSRSIDINRRLQRELLEEPAR